MNGHTAPVPDIELELQLLDDNRRLLTTLIQYGTIPELSFIEDLRAENQRLRRSLQNAWTRFWAGSSDRGQQ